MKRIHKQHLNKKHRKQSGGGDLSFLKPQPITATPLKYGATNPSEEAFLEVQHMNQEQNAINNGEVVSTSQTGGNQLVMPESGVTVPQSDAPLANEPGGANEINTKLTQILMQQGADATMDGCVGQGAGCTADNYWDGKGGSRKTKKALKHKKYRTRKVNKHTKTTKSKKITKTKKTNKHRKNSKSKKTIKSRK